MAGRAALLITRKLPEAVETRAARDYEVIANPEDRVFARDELIEKCRDVDAVMPCHSEKFTAEMIEALPERLKVIANFSVGVDHVDLEAAKRKGIIVTNTPDVLSDATAEIAILLMLGAARRASEGDRMVREGRWDRWSPAFMVGRQLTGRRLGIVGMGRVGQVVAHRARGLGMEIHYHNRRRLEPETEAGAVFHETLDDLLSVSDVLSLHCPTTAESTGMMDAKAFDRLPDGAIFVNTARGALVDEAALVAALTSGRLFAAGLDVFREEPGGNPEIAKLENVFLLPHIGSATFETRDAMGFRALDNLDAVFAGREPRDRVA